MRPFLDVDTRHVIKVAVVSRIVVLILSALSRAVVPAHDAADVFRGKQNNPLFIRTFQADEEPEAADVATRLHYVVHAALDVVEERGATPHAACPALPS